MCRKNVFLKKIGVNVKQQTQNQFTNQFSGAAAEQSDAALLLRCRAGDEAAWQALVDRFQRLIASIPRRAGLSEDQTAEVFQEVFIALFEKMHGIEQPERLRAWLVTTAKYKTWQTVARRNDNIESFDADENELGKIEFADKSLLPDAVLIELEQQHLIRAALSELDERCQTILQMLYLRDPAATYAEVAQIINTGETSISPLRARCLKKMLKKLSPENLEQR